MLREGQILFTYLHLAPDPEQTADLIAARRRLHRLRDGHRRRAAGCRCWRRCRRSPAGWRCRPARTSSRRRRAARASCWAAFRACPGQGRHARRRRRRHARHRRSPLGMGARRDGDRPQRRRAATPGRSSAPARYGVLDARRDRARASPTPTSSSARCWCPARPRRSSSRARWWRTDEAGRGASSTSRSTRGAASRPRTPTTHAEPTYVVDGVVHYCVANMPGACPRTSTLRAQQRHPAVRRRDRRQGMASARSPTIRICDRASTSRTGR